MREGHPFEPGGGDPPRRPWNFERKDEVAAWRGMLLPIGIVFALSLGFCVQCERHSPPSVMESERG